MPHMQLSANAPSVDTSVHVTGHSSRLGSAVRCVVRAYTRVVIDPHPIPDGALAHAALHASVVR